MENLDRDIYHIISNYFSDRISKPDLEYLNDWLNQSDDHKHVFAELEKVGSDNLVPSLRAPRYIQPKLKRPRVITQRTEKSEQLQVQTEAIFYAYNPCN